MPKSRLGEKLNVSKNIAKNTAVLFVGNLLFRLISLLVVIYLARYLGVETFGKYNFIFAYLAIFMITSDLGLNQILIREMSRNKERIPELIGNGLIIKILLSIVSIIMANGIILSLGYPKDIIIYTLIASMILLFQSFSDSQKTLFSVYLKMEYDVTSKILNRLLSAFLIFIIIYVKGTLLQIILALIFAEFVGTLLNRYFSRKLTTIKYGIDIAVWKKLLIESIPVALSGFFLIICHRIDVIMLSILEGNISVGFYSAAYRLSEPLILISYALVASLFPLMSSLFTTSKKDLIKMYDYGFKYIFIIMLPICLGIMLLADNIIFLIYGEEYLNSVAALKILSWSLFFVSINYLYSQLLIATNKQRFVTIVMFFTVITNIILNYFLIKDYSFVGASYATLITEILLSITCCVYLSNYLSHTPIQSYILKSLASSLGMGTIISVLKVQNTNLFYIIIISGLAYGIMFTILKGISNDEISLFKRAIRYK